MPADRIPTIDALLCERCGYELDGLELDTGCPECALPIRTSLPRRRPGSPYQNRRKLTSLFKTMLLVMFCPKRTIRNLDIDKGSGVSMMWKGLFVSAVLFTLAYLSLTIGMFIVFSPGNAVSTILGPVIMIIVVGLVVWLVPVGYAFLGYLRVRWLARQRASRMPVAVAWTITGHASLGLMLAPLMMALGLLVQTPFTIVFLSMENPSDELMLYAGILSIISGILSIISGILFILAIPLALAEFEVLLSMGTRRLRFRNLVASDDVRDTAPAPQTPIPDAGHRMDIS
jgi:hypothetical protein